MNKRVWSIRLMVVIIVNILLIGVVFADEQHRIDLTIDSRTAFINDVVYNLDQAPMISEGRTLVPLHFIGEAMEAETRWDSGTRTVTFKRASHEIMLNIGVTTALVNGEGMALDTPPVIYNGRTLVPLRFISEIVDAKVDWDPDLRRVTVIIAAEAKTGNGINVKNYGAKGDGLADDTAAVQRALQDNDLVHIPDGTYMINVDRPLKPRSNQTILMSENAVLKAIPTSSDYHSVLRIENADNVTVSGGSIVGERYEHLGTGGEHGMGITILSGSSNIEISNVRISDFWGDGIYLGGSPRVSQITIENVISDNNRRQGISVVHAEDVTIRNSVFKNTNGAKPQAGIDIEPNRNQSAQNIRIIDTEVLNNRGQGILLYGGFGLIKGVEITGCTIKDSFLRGIEIVNAQDVVLSDNTETNNGIRWR